MAIETRHANELAAIGEYITQFRPEDFSTSGALARPTPENRTAIERLKTRLRRKRRLAAALHERLEHEQFRADEVILTQAEVDALLARWA
ncbi:MAG: hypothetical protein M0T76_10720 [Desulfobacteraceae bacterium]|nr:hypothetical protein [Desulfobacteraceae bacterium]